MPVPLIALGVTSAISAYQAHKQGQAVDAQRGLMDQQSSLARQMQSMGAQQFAMGQPALNKAMDYYKTLAVGNRGAVNQLLAPQIKQVNDIYRGSQAGIEARTPQGPQRDQAIAELMRQRAGTLGMMPIEGRQNAIGQLAGMGQNSINSGLNAFSGSGQNLLGAAKTGESAFGMQGEVNGMWNGIGNSLMQTMLPYLLQMKGGKSTLPSNSTLPGGNVQWQMPGQSGGTF